MISADNRPELSDERACARAFRDHIDEVVSDVIAGTRRNIENRFQDSAEQLRERVRDGLALLVQYLEGGEDFGALYAGQQIFELTRLEKSRTENLQEYKRAVEEDGNVYRAFLNSHVSTSALTAFENAYRRLTVGLVKEAPRHVRTLFIGDCMLSEILSFVVGPLLNEGLSIEPFPINPRDPVQLGRILDTLATKQFDVVFFSPFSHSRLPELEALGDWRLTFSSFQGIQTLVNSIIDQTRSLLEELSKRFECPIFVHNAGFVARGTSVSKTAVRLFLGYRARRFAEPRINQWLADYIATANSASYHHLFLIEETEMVRQFGRLSLGQYLNTSKYQHTVALSRRIASEYRARISAVGHLLRKKLVVCDLDNTLWDGVIGEGTVSHFEDRQKSLKRLKDHAGVVLSISSKNDPKNVSFDGGILASTDFVAPQINWNQKSDAIARIKDTLNLQTRHMVFLDDRPDERAMVQESFPDVLTLDPADSETWKRIDLWAAMAFGSSDVDRTRMYQEQALRDAATVVEDDPAVHADTNTLKKLGLVISISSAKRGDLKRVAELINRTNQWNLCGSRTSFEQVRTWHDSDTAHVLIANVADRFGDMGTVCTSIVTEYEDRVEIPVFVLSCRVFGYGVESAMLAEIGRRYSGGGSAKPVVGHFRSNTQNHPCRNMYSDHGFEYENDVFRWTGAAPLPGVPWAEVKSSE